jgi:glycosyltransferase involved in cell wall biosynthesis
MTVLLLTDADVFAGTERHILSLACALQGEQIEVKIGCPVPSPLAQQAAAAKIEVISIAKRGLIDWRAAKQLRRLVKSGQIHLVHTHNGRTCLAAAIGLWGTRGRLVASQHFLDPAHTRRHGAAAMVSRILHHWMNGRVDKFIAVSQAVADALCPREKISRDRIAVIHNGLAASPAEPLRPVSEVRGVLGIDPQAPLVVCAARLEAEKNIGALILAMQSVRERLPAARCLIAGKGSLHPALAAQIEQLGLTGHVRLLGFRTDVPSLINAGDCFVLPSHAEPFGLVLLEAMALAKPVVATHVAGPLEIVDAGVTGLLVAPSDSAGLADSIVRLLTDRALAATMGQAGRRRLESHFTDQRMAAATAAVYRQVVSS